MPVLLPALGQMNARAQIPPPAPPAADASTGGSAQPGSASDSAVPAGPGLTWLGTGSGGTSFAVPTGRTFRIVRRASLTETLTDNVALSTTDRRVETITQATFGAQLASTAGRVRGSADYALSGNYYGRGSYGSNLQNALTATLFGEVVERRVYVDASAGISQQMISAFGTQSVDPALVNANRTEVRTYRISPYVRGLVPGVASYEFRIARVATHVVGSSVGGIASSTASVLLSGVGTRRVNWSLNASHQVVDDASGESRNGDTLNATVFVTPLPELRLSFFGGYASGNYVNNVRTSGTTYGARLLWNPTPRSTFIAERQRALLADTHTLSLAHRMQRSALLLSDSRSVVISGLQPDNPIRLTLFDQYYLAFERVQPNEDLRRALVNEFLRANGWRATDLAPLSLLSSATSVQRSQSVSYSLFGRLDTATLFASRTVTDRLDTRATVLAGDLATYTRVEQQGLGLNWSRRLTPVSTLSAALSYQRNVGNPGATNETFTRLRSGSVFWSTRITPWIGASLAGRHTRFEGRVGSYHESAVIASLNARF